MQHALDICQGQIADAERYHEPRKTLQKDWQRYFQQVLGDWTDDDCDSMDRLTTSYCEALKTSLSHRFPEPDILTAFRIFDPNRIPMQRADRLSYADADLDTLCAKFEISDPGKLHIDWPSFAEKLLHVRRENPVSVRSASDVCTMVLREPIYDQVWPGKNRFRL